MSHTGRARVRGVEAWVYIRNASTPRTLPSPGYTAIIAYAYGRLGHELSILMDALSGSDMQRAPDENA